ncbi:hypothetical protein [Marinobacter sp. LV10MA510-1]|jgi:type III secretory pathway component EscR|uniref:hypothetical protein n=1 Tax=Marinobacter sp. LV10MA510-1 TaxID=1415567 RepID=UPI000C017040|nr:hypothetical protein [Marinobacter sp. LV10MA510-1]PFG07869.1 hypothetical protein ATI45_0069 [Marinobacter sp. LV10MA510-1]
MAASKREKVQSTPFADFMRHASSEEKSDFFSKVVKETIEEQRQMIAKAQSVAVS